MAAEVAPDEPAAGGAADSAGVQAANTTAAHDPRRRRRERRQRPGLEARARARRRQLEYLDAARPGKRAAAARRLGIAPRTARHWRCQGPVTLPCRGRPCQTCDRERRQDVLRFLAEVSGPDISLAALRALFTDLPRCILGDLVTRYRRVLRRRYDHEGYRLEWLVPGRVWAIDFSQPRQPVDGCLPNLMAVRDLASHQQLAWQATATQAADEACAVLERLFLDHGPPLVLKADNGSAFISAEFQSLLARYGVVILYSPPRYPQYNGALERSNGTLKTFTQLDATRDGHPLRWTSDNVERARELANELTRPWGARGPTPAEAWSARTALTQAERHPFLASVESHRVTAALELGLDPQARLGRDDQARLDRVAVPRCLIELRYLECRAGRRAQKRAARPTLSAPPADLPVAGAPVGEPTDVWWAGPPQALPGGSQLLTLAAQPLRRQRRLTAAPSRLPPPLTPLVIDCVPLLDSPNFNSTHQILLANTGSLDTMTGDKGVGDGATQLPPIPGTAHGEQSPTSWFGRLIAPLIHSLKAAKIM